MPISPHAPEAERKVFAWFESLGCSATEIERSRKFDIAGYVGIPFPGLSRDTTVTIAKYLSMWLLWDDMQIECLANRWRIDVDHVLADRRPDGMTRFDEGWWQLFRNFAGRRSRQWISDVCGAMIAWNDAAVDEAVAMETYRQRGVLPAFFAQMEMRVATIGMYATVYLLEDAYDFELPRALHAQPTVLRLKWLANQIVGLGNDIFSFGKDVAEKQINLASTLIAETGVSSDSALAELIRLHDVAIEEYDRLAATVGGYGAKIDSVIHRWLQDVRYASLGFSIWESRAPRYTAHKIVESGRVVEPVITFTTPSAITEA